VDFREFDYILAMDNQNLQNLTKMKLRYGFPDKTIFLMRDFVEEEKGQSVPDPYYGGEEGFHEIYRILDRSIESFLEELKERHQLYA
jgi:protein-tyrosine-phosphatase